MHNQEHLRVEKAWKKGSRIRCLLNAFYLGKWIVLSVR